MTTPARPRYRTKAFGWTMTVAANSFVCSNGLSTIYSTPQSISGEINAFRAPVAGQTLCDMIETALNSAYNEIFGADGGAYYVGYNTDGRLRISNDTYNNMRINTDNDSAISLLLGGGVTDDADDYPNVIFAGVDVLSKYQPIGWWSPHMFSREDTGDRRQVEREQSTTKTRRPRLIRHSLPYYQRHISWETVPACYVVQNRARYYDLAYAEVGGSASEDYLGGEGDPNCAIEQMLDYLDGSWSFAGGDIVPSTTTRGVYIIEDFSREVYPQSETLPYDNNFPYRYDVEVDPKLLNDISQDAIYTASAVESFGFWLKFRRIQ